MQFGRILQPVTMFSLDARPAPHWVLHDLVLGLPSQECSGESRNLNSNCDVMGVGSQK